jgi:hypothetical protein
MRLNKFDKRFLAKNDVSDYFDYLSTLHVTEVKNYIFCNKYVI